jgi:hypothetical protein
MRTMTAHEEGAESKTRAGLFYKLPPTLIAIEAAPSNPPLFQRDTHYPTKGILLKVV